MVTGMEAENQSEALDRYREIRNAAKRNGCSIRDLERYFLFGKKPEEREKRYPLIGPGAGGDGKER